MIDFDKLCIPYDAELADIYTEGERLYKDLGGYIFDKSRIEKLSKEYNIFRENLDSVLETADLILNDDTLSWYSYVILAAIKAHKKISLEAMPDFNNPKTDLMLIYPIFYFAEEMIENMQKRGLPYKIISDTLADFDSTLNSYKAIFGRCGARINYNWLVPYVYGKLVRINRFNIEIAKFNDNVAVYNVDGKITIHTDCVKKDDNAVLKGGDDVLSVHIPRGLPLNDSITEQSLNYTIDIFKKYYPEYNIKAFVCYSWLLNPQLPDIMGKETNITRFASNFVRFPIENTGNDVYKFLYNTLTKPQSPELLPENTTMQKKVKEFLCSGNIYYSFGGVKLI